MLRLSIYHKAAPPAGGRLEVNGMGQTIAHEIGGGALFFSSLYHVAQNVEMSDLNFVIRLKTWSVRDKKRVRS